MNYLNTKRSGDDNIWKLIVFAVTIIIAIGLVGLVTYFYNQSRQQAVATGVLGSTSSTQADIRKLPNLGNCEATAITYDAIANTYSLSGATSLTSGNCNLSNVKGVTVSGSGYTLSN